MTIAEALLWAANILQTNGVTEPRREAVKLLDFVLRRGRAYLIAHSDEQMSADDVDRFASAIKRRATREPFQYIVRTEEFCGCEFEVAPGVLIPRPETEMLVSAAAAHLHNIERPRFLEIGVGTGCIAISVLKQVATSYGLGIDISQESITLAARNAERLAVCDRFDLRLGDLFEAVGNDRFDAIISNPPYIPASDIDGLQPEVRDFEPISALTDGGSGLSIIRKIICGAPDHMVPGGVLILEFGFGQASDVAAMFDPGVWCSIHIHNDLRSVERMAVATLT